MSEPNWTHSNESSPEKLGAEGIDVALEIAQPTALHLPSELVDLPPSEVGLIAANAADPLQTTEQKRLAPFKESLKARQTNSTAKPLLEPEAKQRIHQLEQALEQSLSTLEQFKSQLSEQQLLETQLAATEEVANLQQQALAQLKQQLVLTQQALDTQVNQAQIKDQTVQELWITIETLVQAQQAELQELRTQMSQDRRAIQTSQKLLETQLSERQTSLQVQQQRVQQLESQILEGRTLAARLEIQLAEAQQRIEALYDRLSERSYALTQLEGQLQQAHDALEVQQELVATLRQTQTQVLEQNTTIAALYNKIEALETQLAQQLKIQARLQQACSELSAERDHYQSRTAELEPHTATLQEQILMQAQQASEYEAAIQYWKDRCVISQRHAQQLKNILEQVLPDSSAELEELLRTVETSTSAEISSVIPPPLASPQSGKHLQVDLPGFLRKAKGTAKQ